MKTKRPFSHVYPLAEKLLQALSPACHRIELAGSLRREKDEIGDIELVCVPRAHKDLFGNPLEHTLLDDLLSALVVQEKIHMSKNGKKYKQFDFRSIKGLRYQVDLFIQPNPATWGVNFLIRTGSADFSRMMVTKRSQGGAMPDKYRVKDARVWCEGRALETPEETDIFHLWGIPYMEPQHRTPERLQLETLEASGVLAA